MLCLQPLSLALFFLQVRSWEGAGEEEEDWSITGMPCIRHISDMAGVSGVQQVPARGRQARAQGQGMGGQTPQPEVHVKAVTTPLVCSLFESTFQQQMKDNQTRQSVGRKVCLSHCSP